MRFRKHRSSPGGSTRRHSYYHEPETLKSLYQVTEESVPGIIENTDLVARLSNVRTAAADMGFTSLLDAAFADAQLYAQEGMDPHDRNQMEEFVQLGKFAELVSIIQKSNSSTHGRIQFAPTDLSDVEINALSQDHFLPEWEAIRQLPCLNQPFKDWTLEYLSNFSFHDLFLQMERSAPNLFALLTAFIASRKSNSPIPQDKQHRYIVTALTVLANLMNQKTNYVQGMMGLYLYASKVPKRVIQVLNHIGTSVSYDSVRNYVTTAAASARKRLRKVSSLGTAHINVFDNLTITARVRDHRFHNEDGFLTYTAGFTLIPPSARRYPRFSRKKTLNLHKIQSLNALHFIPSATDANNMEKSFMYLIADVLIRFAKEHGVAIADLGFRMPSIFQIDRHQIPEVLTYPTYDLNEAEMDELIEILNSIQKDTGITEEQCVDDLVMYQGDFLTVRNIRYILSPPPALWKLKLIDQRCAIKTIRMFKPDESSTYRSSRWLVPSRNECPCSDFQNSLRQTVRYVLN
jgi:hypothetical protein